MKADHAGLPNRFWKRVLIWGALLLLIYLVVVNAFINSPLIGPLINKRPERFSMQWERAVMIWPGQISVWGVQMRGHSRRMVWDIGADHASGRLAIWPLLQKELHFVGVNAVNPRVNLKRVEAELEPLPRKSNAMRLVFDGLNVDSPWRFSFNDLAVEGHVKAKGRFRLQLRGGEFELLPSDFHLSKTRLAYASHELLTEGDIQGRVKIDAHARGDVRGVDILNYLVVDAAIQSKVAGVRLDSDADLRLNSVLLPSSGTLDGRVVLTHGALGVNTDLKAALAVVGVTSSGVTTEGDALVRVSVDEAIRMQLEMPSLPNMIQRLDAMLMLEGSALPLPPWQAQWARLGGEIALESRFSSLAMVQPLLSRLKTMHLDGSGNVEGRVIVANGKLAPGTQLTVHEANFDLAAYSHRFKGAAHAKASFIEGLNGEPQAVAEVVLDRFDFSPENERDVVLGSGRDLRLDLAASGELAQLNERMTARLYFKDLRLPELAAFNRYLPRNGVKLLSGQGALAADMQMDVAKDSSSGSLGLTARGASIRLGDLILRTDLSLDARMADGRLDDRSFSLPGTRLRLDRTAVLEPKGERIEAWKGVANVTQGYVHLGEPLKVTANAEISMTNVAPLLAMFAQNARFPKWIRRVIDAGEAKVVGRLSLDDDGVVIDGVNASNERFDVKARMRLGEAKPNGQLYARWGVMGVGLELRDGERDIRVVGAKKWFESQPPYLREH